MLTRAKNMMFCIEKYGNFTDGKMEISFYFLYAGNHKSDYSNKCSEFLG